jgi:Putative metallopeptidase
VGRRRRVRAPPREDAADNVAAFLLLRAGEGVARRVLGGAAWMYLHDAKGRMPDESDFADVHGLDSQRFYNVLCMAHGSNPAAFQGMVDKGYLPKERAEGCKEEFQQVAYAVKKLIDPSVDAQLAARIKAAHKARWEAPPKQTAQSTQTPPK